MGDLYVDYRKWPEAAHWHFTVHALGDDAHGRWFYLPAGAALQRGSEPEQRHARTAAMLFREGAWWTALWNSNRSQPYELYIDVTTPPVWRSGRVTMFDLDLDVVRTWDGGVEVLDRDEFQAHREQLGYPADLVEAAERSTRDLVRRLERRDEPFGSVGAAWLEAALGRDGGRVQR